MESWTVGCIPSSDVRPGRTLTPSALKGTRDIFYMGVMGVRRLSSRWDDPMVATLGIFALPPH